MAHIARDETHTNWYAIGVAHGRRHATRSIRASQHDVGRVDKILRDGVEGDADRQYLAGFRCGLRLTAPATKPGHDVKGGAGISER